VDPGFRAARQTLLRDFWKLLHFSFFFRPLFLSLLKGPPA
jgi:hypothetical protein